MYRQGSCDCADLTLGQEHGFFYTSLDELLVLNVTLVSTSDIHSNMATSTDEEINALLQQIAVQGQDWKKGTAGAREALLDSASRLRSSLLTPLETLLLTQWSQPTVNAALLLGTQIGLFEALAAQNGAPKSSKAIANLTTPSADPLLVARMLRLLASTNYVRETEADVFAPTPFANAMTQQGYKDTVYLMCTNFQHGHTNVADYFKQNGYKSPDSVLFTPLSHALGLKDVSVYEYWGKLNPKAGAKFASCMATYTSDRPAWFQEGYYPVKDRLITGARSGPDETFMVDLGGSTGHDLTRLLQAFGPQIPGKLVLQDRPEVVKLAEKEAAPEVVKMPHDFFLEQPVTRKSIRFPFHRERRTETYVPRRKSILLPLHRPQLARRRRTLHLPRPRPRAGERLLQSHHLRRRAAQQGRALAGDGDGLGSHDRSGVAGEDGGGVHGVAGERGVEDYGHFHASAGGGFDC